MAGSLPGILESVKCVPCGSLGYDLRHGGGGDFKFHHVLTGLRHSNSSKDAITSCQLLGFLCLVFCLFLYCFVLFFLVVLSMALVASSHVPSAEGSE